MSHTLLDPLHAEINADLDKLSYRIDAAARRPDLSGPERRSMHDLQAKWQICKDHAKDAIDVGETDAAMATMMLGQTDDTFKDVDTIFQTLSNEMSETALGLSNQLYFAAGQNKNIIIWVTIIGCLISGFVAIMVGRSIVRPIEAVTDAMQRLSAGETNVDIGYRDRRDEIGQMVGAIDIFRGIALQNTQLLNELRDRTGELARSVEELRALGEVSQTVNSTLDLETVLATIVAKAVQLSGTEAGTIYGYDAQVREFRLRATYGMGQELIDALSHQHIGFDQRDIAAACASGEPSQIADLHEEARSEVNEIVLRAGYRARLLAPLMRGEEIVGVLVVRRKTPGSFANNIIDLMKTFAAQSVLAIQNARLFHEIDDKSRELEVASRHKSEFLANMSHELRTPLNAILGYSELILDNIYGEAPQRMRAVLERVQANGKHLLDLINDVLDLSKIEAGQLILSLADYSVADMVQSVHTAVEPLASSKKLGFTVDLPRDLPAAYGDDRRLKQVLLNLVGNAIKFTDSGEVAITASVADGAYTIVVRDTGPGIAEADQTKIFEEFQQGDNTQTKSKGGTGLGLAISKRIVEMHGGRLWVNSRPGEGSTFSFTVPLRVAREAGQS
ncbi:MAG TPA: ATP-binding protein [Xanthobacteraceae bacterium]|nr:ATP-binding protein [Xanthobacteraceae bacterium]